MKTRTGFVSNSSSTSFIVIGGYVNPVYEKPEKLRKELRCRKGVLKVGNTGETEFGWGPNTIYDVASRVNFAYMQTQYCENECWLEMLENVLKEYLEVEEVKWNIDTDWLNGDSGCCDNDGKVFGYIDHQSTGPEGKNITMFENKEVLKRFLFCTDSSIVLDNDNH